MILVRLKEVANEAGKWVLKVLRFGKDDVVTPRPVFPFGIESVPAGELLALYADTQRDGKPVLIGYVPEAQVAQKGEVRLYSTNEAGDSVQFYLLCKNDGTAEMGGTADNLVRYTPLNTALQSEKNLIMQNFAAIATAINAIAPGAYTPINVTVDISGAKIDEIKTL